MKITCAFQYELYVDETRRAALSRNAGCRRFVFNKALGIQNERKSKGEKLLTYKELAHELVLWKKQPETAFLREAMSQPLQQALLDLDRAISDSFRPKSDPAHKGWPKFKAKDIGDGFRIPQFAPEHIDDANGRVKLPKIGWIRYRRTRPIAFECADGMLVPGVVKQIHVRKDCGHWFVIFTVEFEVKVPDMKALDVGIDVGVVHAVATSDGRFYDLDTAKIRSIEKRIAGFKRKLSLNQESRKKLAKLGLAEPFDKKQPSRKRRRLKERNQNLYRKIRCIRQDFNRKTAHALAQEYGCVYVEDLKVKNMTASAKGTVANPGKNVKQKSGLNRAILRTGFYNRMATSENGWCGDSRRSERDEHHLPALSEQGQTQPPDAGDFQVRQRKLRLQSECRRGGRPERVEEGPDRPECTQQKAHRPCSEYWGARLSAGGLDAINGNRP